MKDDPQELILGCAVIIAALVALYFLRSLRLEWLPVAGASWAIARLCSQQNNWELSRWVRAYFLAIGVALFPYSLTAAGEDQGLFGVIFHPVHFHNGIKVGVAALLSIWAGIGVAHFSHDPETFKEKQRRKMEAEGIAVIKAGGRWFSHGREMTIFDGRLVPKHPMEPKAK